jgi:hypothetical protein
VSPAIFFTFGHVAASATQYASQNAKNRWPAHCNGRLRRITNALAVVSNHENETLTPAPILTAATLLRRHGDFATYRVMQLIRQAEAESQTNIAWWYRVFDAIWSLTAEQGRGDHSVH